VTVKFDSRQVPVSDREEALREITSRTFAPLEIEHTADRGPTGSIAFTDLTDLRVWSVNCTAVKVDYKAMPGEDLKPSLFLRSAADWILQVGAARPRNQLAAR
jgi:hypothetical protein